MSYRHHRFAAVMSEFETIIIGFILLLRVDESFCLLFHACLHVILDGD